MALTIDYCETWKWLKIDWSTFYTFYGKNFNPNVPTIPTWDTFEADDTTSSFNLLWFQPWHEVGCSVINVNNIEDIDAYLFFYFYQDGYDSWVNNFWLIHFSTEYATYGYYAYFWIDDDEIWEWTSNYSYEWVITTDRYDASSSARIDTASGSFSVSNLSFDDSKHQSWYLWIQWSSLCYIDWTSNTRWYKHTIGTDNYYWWTWEPWYIWIPSWWSDKHIYFTDAYWDIRRTEASELRYWWASYPSWAETWRIWVSNWDYTQWYWYLCYIDGSWQQRRIGNWTP